MNKKFLIFFLLVFPFLHACKDEPTPESLEISLSDFTFEAASGVMSIDVKSNIQWTVESADSWLTCFPTSGENNSNIIVTVDENLVIGVREGKLTITSASGAVSQEFNVLQLGVLPALAVPATMAAVPEGGRVTVPVTVTPPNLAWSVEIPEGAFVSEASRKNNEIVFEVAPNNTGEAREVVITFKLRDADEEATLVITQDLIPVIAVDPTTAEVDPEGGDVTVQVTATSAWTVEIPDDAFVSEKSKTDGTIVFEARSNETGASRKVIITFKLTGTDKEPTLTITQAAKKVVDPDDPSFPASLTGTQFTNNWWGEGNYDVTWLESHTLPTAASPAEYVITTAAQLAGLSFYVNGWGPNATTDKETLRYTTIKLGADIDMSAHYWVPIGSARNSFKGSFDGQGHTISGIYINFTDPYEGTLANSTSGTAAATLYGYSVANVTNLAGLFGRINEANVTVKNLIMGKGLVATHPSSFYTSAVCAYANSAVNFINVINAGTAVIGGIAVGAIVGGTSNIPSLTACANAAPIIAAFEPTEVADATISITALNFAVGGLVGFVQNAAGPIIANSYNAEIVTNRSSSTKLAIGGLLGLSGGALNVATVPSAINVASAASFYVTSPSYRDVGGVETDKITGSAVTAVEMKTPAFLTKLNEGLVGTQWIFVSGENNGFPTFAKP